MSPLGPLIISVWLFLDPCSARLEKLIQHILHRFVAPRNGVSAFPCSSQPPGLDSPFFPLVRGPQGRTVDAEPCQARACNGT